MQQCWNAIDVFDEKKTENNECTPIILFKNFLFKVSEHYSEWVCDSCCLSNIIFVVLFSNK